MNRRAFLLVAAISGLNLTAAAQAADPRVRFETNVGSFVVELYPDKAPKSVDNFLRYVDAHHYDGTIFHRVIAGFVAQGGGFDRDMREKPTRAPIENEAKNGLRNARGTLAMARTQRPHSATSQFYINFVDNSSLDYPSFDGWGYAVFGKVVSGMDIVDAFAKQRTGVKAGQPDVPLEPIVVVSAKRVEATPN